MNEPIYFSKIQFVEGFIYNEPRTVIFIDLLKRELSYQVYSWKRNMPTIQGEKKDEEWERLTGKEEIYPFTAPAKMIRSGKNGFQTTLIPDESFVKNVEFSYGLHLDQRQYEDLLPYCNAIDFEPYRNRTMSMDDEGFIGYRDEIKVSFCGVTASYIPYIELPMNYYYDEKHIWPSEKLYCYIYQTFLNNDKKLKKWVMGYGALSLLF